MSNKPLSKEDYELFCSVQAKKAPHNVGSFPRDEAKSIMINQKAFTTATSKFPILASQNANSGIIGAIYNPITKEAALAHIDSYTKLSSFINQIDQLSGSGATLQICLAGGNKESINDNAMELLKLLTNYKGCELEISTSNFCTNSSKDSDESLAIDARTGTIFTRIYISYAEKDMMKMNLSHLKLLTAFCGAFIYGSSPYTDLSLVFDGRKSEDISYTATFEHAPAPAPAPATSAIPAGYYDDPDFGWLPIRTELFKPLGDSPPADE